jgi:hypothetical protein
MRALSLPTRASYLYTTVIVIDRTKTQPFHAYIFGTSFWYGLRGFARLTDPVRVSTWFRPPAQPLLKPTGMYR